MKARSVNHFCENVGWIIGRWNVNQMLVTGEYFPGKYRLGREVVICVVWRGGSKRNMRSQNDGTNEVTECDRIEVHGAFSSGERGGEACF
jgi:hypothetical protein